MTRVPKTLGVLLLFASSQAACFYYQDRVVEDGSADEEPCPQSVPAGDLCWDASHGAEATQWVLKPESVGSAWGFVGRVGWQFQGTRVEPVPGPAAQLISRKLALSRQCLPSERRRVACQVSHRLEGTLPYKLTIQDGQPSKLLLELSGPAEIAEEFSVQLYPTETLLTLQFGVDLTKKTSWGAERWTIRRLRCQTDCIAQGAAPTGIVEKTP